MASASNNEDHATTGGGADNKNTIQFKQFDVVPEASDHHYLKSSKGQKINEGNNSSFYTKIMREWKILEKNLPETIYVQVYETRIDLLRAVIIGPQGTPYHDCLFFFDILLPYDYPNHPPKVHYRSHGYRLNPNLYASGKVCLSLINTWTGTRTEKWTQNSTILQILVSIQGLVLNEKPYFNEPGYANQKDSKSSSWINASVKYNEDAFILSCMTMLHIVRKPPVNYEVFVEQYVRARGPLLLASTKSYQESYVPIGRNFKANLGKIYSGLKKEFALIDKNSKKKKKVEVEESSNTVDRNQEKVKKHKNGIFKNFLKCF